MIYKKKMVFQNKCYSGNCHNALLWLAPTSGPLVFLRFRNFRRFIAPINRKIRLKLSIPKNSGLKWLKQKFACPHVRSLFLFVVALPNCPIINYFQSQKSSVHLPEQLFPSTFNFQSLYINQPLWSWLKLSNPLEWSPRRSQSRVSRESQLTICGVKSWPVMPGIRWPCLTDVLLCWVRVRPFSVSYDF